MKSLIIFALFLPQLLLAQTVPQCPEGSHFDPNLEECIEDTKPQECEEGFEWHEEMGHCMAVEKSKSSLHMHTDAYLVQNSASGPRGRNATYSPNMFMLDYERDISAKHRIKFSFMGTLEKWTVPSDGYPLIGQAGESNVDGKPYIDAQHPHSSPIMGLTFSDIVSLGSNGNHKLTFFFAPRGEPTSCPDAFMHRPSADGNPDAPLSHHLQDVCHISSTVAGVKYDNKKTSIGFSGYSGVEPSPGEVNLDVHPIDSFGFKVTQKLSERVSIGISAADIKAAHREVGHGGESHGTEDERALAAWIKTNSLIYGGKLNTSLIWGQVENRSEKRTLQSFLAELAYQLGRNNFFGRVEFLQRTKDQLHIHITEDKNMWLNPITLGYIRNLTKPQKDTQVSLGASYTKTFVAPELSAAYGGNPDAGKAFIRVRWGKNKSWK